MGSGQWTVDIRAPTLLVRMGEDRVQPPVFAAVTEVNKSGGNQLLVLVYGFGAKHRGDARHRIRRSRSSKSSPEARVGCVVPEEFCIIALPLPLQGHCIRPYYLWQSYVLAACSRRPNEVYRADIPSKWTTATKTWVDCFSFALVSKEHSEHAYHLFDRQS